MARPQADVRADQGLDEVKDLVVQQELEQARIPEVRRVGACPPDARQVLLENRVDPRELLGGEDRLVIVDVPVLGAFCGVGRGKAMEEKILHIDTGEPLSTFTEARYY